MELLSASPAFKRGDLILAEDPFVFTVSSNQVETRCHNCLAWLAQEEDEEIPARSRCSACRYSRYCSKKCQKSDWKKCHKTECSSLARLAASGFRAPDHFMLMLKIMLKTDSDFTNISSSTQGASLKEKETHDRSYDDLIHHEEEMLEDKDVMDYVPQIRLILAKYVGISDPRQLPSMRTVFEMFGKVKCNAYAIQDDSLLRCGVGVYLNASAFDHSCQPNACQVFEGPRIFIRAMEDIQRKDQVRISYIERFAPDDTRQRLLREGFFFTCACPRCEDPARYMEMHPVKCANVHCTAKNCPPRGDDALICHACHIVIPTHFATNGRHGMVELYDNLAQKDSLDGKDAAEMVSVLEQYQHPMNMLLAQLYVNMARDQADGSAGLYFAKAAEIYRHYLPHPAVDPVMGWVFLQAACTTQRGDFKSTRDYLTEAERILRVTHGIDHPLYKSIPSL